jgi:hypothetical protein
MSPSQVNANSAPEESYDYVHIDDFTPGIYANTYAARNQGTPISAPWVPAPLGAATPQGTWGCAALRTGGLAPLPTISTTHTQGPISGAASQLVAGFIVNPGTVGSVGDEVIEIYEADDGANHHYNAYSIQPGAGYATNVIVNPTTATTAAGYFGAPYPVFSRMNATGTGNPPPVIVFPAGVAVVASTGALYVYPQISSPGTYGAQNIVGSSVTGQVIAYGSRILTLVSASYTWPTGTIQTNENINFTDPPLSSTNGNQLEILGAEWPFGYGAWGSVSVGELLFVKKRAGAVIMYGDIANPTSAVEVPGVQPTGNLVGRAAATPQGLIYCSEKRGAWLWNGGNTATKISQQIEDDFFDLETGAITSNNYGFYVEPWQNYMLFSHNWLWNSESNSWWILYPTTSQSAQSTYLTAYDLWWYSPGAAGNLMYAAPLISSTANSWLGFITFDSQVGGSREYRWESVPIHVNKDADRNVDIRQLTVTASDPTGSNTCKIQPFVGSWTGAASTTVIGTLPTTLRYNVGAGALGLTDIVGLTIHAWNTASASGPIIHSIDIGYQIRAKVTVQN